MKKEKVSFDDLELAKNQMAGNFARSLENPQTIARFALNIKLYDLPEDYYKNYLKNINAVSVDDVQEMAVKYLKPENLIILVVGNRDEVAEKLIKFSSKDIIEYYDIYGNPLMEVPKVIPEGMTYEYVIASYLNNIGGKKKLSEIKNIYTKIHAELNVQGQQMEASITSFKKAPDLFKSVTYMGDMLIQKQIFDGEKGLSASVSGEVAITGKQLEELKLQSVIFPELHYKDLGYKLKLLLIEKLKGNYAYKIEIISPLGNKQYDYFDIDTGMLIRSLNTTESPSGEITTITDFSDYKDVDGIKFPHFMEINAGPQLIKINIVSIDIKSEIDNKEFIIEK
ncbi:MAG: insulinase family protein [Bacteroidetes bacterium]|nr:insulinase family protein [Bacteroidota bacterium]